MLTALAGLIAGAVHVFSGPDHLAAIAPIAVGQRRRAWRAGLLWGLGHSGGVWVLAVLALSFREALPIDLLSSWGERMVGFVLIGLGLLGLRRLFRTHIHSHVHEHDGVRHTHVHVHEHTLRTHDPTDHRHSHSAFGIGTLHGVAGTSHLVGVIPALLLPDRLAAVTYVAAYGAGSIMAMTAFSWVLGMFGCQLRRLGDRVHGTLLGVCCVAAIVIGCYWSWASFAPTHVQP